MNSGLNQRSRRLVANAFACALAGAFTGGFVGAAGKIVNTGKDFNVVLEYHAAPNDTQPKATLAGAQAEFDGGLIYIRGLTLLTLGTNGQTEVTVQSPQCVFDPAKHAVSSPGYIKALSGDGGFSIEGQGFLWQQTNNVLIISNRVQSVIRNAPEKSAR